MVKKEEENGRMLEGNGGKLPALGFGTWDLRGNECVKAVRYALDIGYRHLDTAEMYGNEEQVGRGIQESKIDRESIFLATKVWYDNLDAAGIKRSAEQSLQRLRTEYVDLLLMHWPHQVIPLEESLSAMNDLKAEGKTRHIGVSNFTVDLMKKAQSCSSAPVFCNQVEYHPYLSQKPVLEHCRKNGVLLVAYCPLGRGRVFTDSTLSRIAGKYGRTKAQITLRWLLQQPGVAAIPRSSSEVHIRENSEIFDFQLSKEDMEEIFSLQKGHRIVTEQRVPIPTPSWDT